MIGAAGPNVDRIWTISATFAILAVALLAIASVATATEVEYETSRFGGGPDELSIEGDRLLAQTWVYERDGGAWTQEAFLHAGDASDLDGETIIVGQWWDDNANGEDAGAAYIYERNATGGWNQQAKLIASDGDVWDWFGFSVAIDGDTAVVGAERDHNANGDRAGAAYIFTLENGVWTEQAKVVGSHGEDTQDFGYDVDVDNGTVIVGTRWGGEWHQGGAYVYTESGGSWSEQAFLTVNNGWQTEHNMMGDAVAVQDDIVLVGGPGDSWFNDDPPGEVFIFERTGTSWSLEATLTASDGVTDDLFGTSVDLDGRHVIVGAPGDRDEDDELHGAAYLFSKDGSGWTELAKLNATGSEPSYDLGQSVSLSEGTMVVGSHRNVNLYRGPPRDLRTTAAADPWTVELSWAHLQAEASTVYHINRSTSPNGPFQEIATTTQMSYVDTGLADQRYYYKVSAETGGSYEPDEDSIASVHPRPAAPTSLTGQTDTVPEQAMLDWEEPAGIQGTPVYRVFRSTQEGGPYGLIAETTETSYHDADLQPGTYHYVVTTDRNGVESPLSDPVTVTAGTRTTSSPDDAQNDAGTGEDASDDPDDPTILAGGKLIRINGTLIPAEDPVDAYGTRLSPNATINMSFNFHVPATMGLQLRLIDPDGNLHDTATAPIEGGNISVSARAPAGEHLQEGVWVTVLEHGTQVQTAADTTWDAGHAAPLAHPTPGGSPGTALPSPATEGMALATPGGGLLPGAVPSGFAVIDYRDGRPCDPKC